MIRSTARFQAQHAEITRLAGELQALLDPVALASDATAARRALATLGGRLRIHSAMENEALYPRLLSCGDAAVERTARALFDSFGDLYEKFSAHARKWSEGDAVARSPDAFVDETTAILARLRERIAREDAELYPLADRLDA